MADVERFDRAGIEQALREGRTAFRGDFGPDDVPIGLGAVLERLSMAGRPGVAAMVVFASRGDSAERSVWVPCTWMEGAGTVAWLSQASASRAVASVRARRAGREAFDEALPQVRGGSGPADPGLGGKGEAPEVVRGQAVVNAKRAALRGKPPGDVSGGSAWLAVTGKGGDFARERDVSARVLVVDDPTGEWPHLFVPVALRREGERDVVVAFGAVEESLLKAIGDAVFARGACSRGLHLKYEATSSAEVDGAHVAEWGLGDGFRPPTLDDAAGNFAVWEASDMVDGAEMWPGLVDHMECGVLRYNGIGNSERHHPVIADAGGQPAVDWHYSAPDSATALNYARALAEARLGEMAAEAARRPVPHDAFDGGDGWPVEASIRVRRYLEGERSVIPVAPDGNERRTVDLLHWGLDPNHDRSAPGTTEPPECSSLVLGTFVEAVERLAPARAWMRPRWRAVACEALCGSGRDPGLEAERRMALAVGLRNWAGAAALDPSDLDSAYGVMAFLQEHHAGPWVDDQGMQGALDYWSDLLDEIISDEINIGVAYESELGPAR